MMLVIFNAALQLAALAVQGVQCWLDARRRGPCPRCSSSRAPRPAGGRRHKGRHRLSSG